MHAEEAAVGNRARVRDREPSRALPAADHSGGAIPDDARPQLGELVGRVAAGEHVEHVLELRARDVGEGIGAADELVQVVDADLLVGGDGDDLLRKDVERVAWNDRLLDRTLEHALCNDGRFEQIGAELREDAPLRDGAELVAGAADALQTARDRLRRLDLQDEVDRAHVDAQLERRGGDETGDLPRLEQLLDLHALLARERAVVCASDLPRLRLRSRRRGSGGFATATGCRSQLVEPQREPLRQPAVVHEQDRRPMRFDQAQQLGIDRRPDRRLLGLAHVLEGHDHLQVELLRGTGVDELDLPRARDEAADLLQRPLRRREPDPL